MLSTERGESRVDPTELESPQPGCDKKVLSDSAYSLPMTVTYMFFLGIKGGRITWGKRRNWGYFLETFTRGNSISIIIRGKTKSDVISPFIPERALPSRLGREFLRSRPFIFKFPYLNYHFSPFIPQQTRKHKVGSIL